MNIAFTKKPVYTVGDREFPTLEEAQQAAIADLHERFSGDLPEIILENAPALTEIFKQSPRVRSSPRKRRAKPTKVEPSPASN
jgi:hypothetical protein